MSMKKFVTEKCKAAHFHIHNIRALRKSLDTETTKKLVHSFILSQFDYANALLYGIPNCDLQKLQSIQNYAAKLILGRQTTDSSRRALFELHWLPINCRIEFKILTLVYKSLKNEAPKYLSELLEFKITDYHTRSEEDLELVVPKTARTGSYGDRAFGKSGPRLWRDIPTNVKIQETFELFKTHLKTFFFRETYSDLILEQEEKNRIKKRK